MNKVKAMRLAVISFFLITSFVSQAQLGPKRTNPKNIPKSEFPMDKKMTPEQKACANWMSNYRKFWLSVLKKNNDQTLDMSTKIPNHRVQFPAAGDPVTMTFSGNEGESMILPTHNNFNNANGVLMEQIAIVKNFPNGVCVGLISYTPGVYADVIAIPQIYKRTSQPGKLFARIKRSNGQFSEIEISENMSRGSCTFPVKS
jgi:hypothetical protein